MKRTEAKISCATVPLIWQRSTVCILKKWPVLLLSIYDKDHVMINLIGTLLNINFVIITLLQ
jgi:hypothetical protein